MLKALLKKEFSQLFSFYSFDNRRNKKRKKGSGALYVLLFALVFFSLGIMFYGMAEALGSALAGKEFEWVYYSIFGVTSVLFGVIGSVFTTHAILYKAKDNEFLLSMPIPPKAILFVRALIVFLSALLIVAIAWIPAVLRTWIANGTTAVQVIMQIVTLLSLTGLVTVLNLLLGWLVAVVSRRIRSKTAATVIFSLLFIGLYYVFYFKVRDILNYIILNLDKIAEVFRGPAYPLYMIGSGAAGNVIHGLLFALAVAALLGIAYAVLSATLLKILTASNAGVKKAVYRAKKEKLASAASALLRKETGRFTSSAVYLLNAGLGVLLMLIAAVVVPFTAKSFIGPLEEMLGSIGIGHLIVFLPVIVCCAVTGMDLISASSVSMEGRNIWIVQSMPVSPALPLRAKLRLHLIVNCVPMVILMVVCGIVLKLTALQMLASCLLGAAFVWLTDAFGLMLNIKKPNLDWTNETVPVKQGMPVLFAMLLGMALNVVNVVAAIALGSFIPAAAVMAALALVYAALAFLCERWILTRGAKIFSDLG